MKKIILFSLLAVALFLSGCKKKSSKSFDDTDLVMQVFAAGMAWNNQASVLKGTIPYNQDVDSYTYGPAGGFIHVIGNVSGEIHFDDQTGYIQGGFYQIGLTEVANDYAFISNGETYTINGDPYLSLTGTFTIAPGGATFGTQSSMQIGGGMRVTGTNGLDQTINVQITININSTGTGGTVSGTIGGRSIYFSF